MMSSITCLGCKLWYISVKWLLLMVQYCCPDNGMSEEARQKFLELHNSLRSSVALGQAKDGAGGNAPKAAKMKTMAYDCEVEKTAMNNAKQCVFKHSQPNQRKGLGENIFMSSDSGMDKAKAAEQASKAWFGELAEKGVGQNLKLTGGLFSRGVGHYTQMVWQETVKLGCYVEACSNMCYVVCQYGPAGNMMGKDIYEKGEPCSKCENCDKEKGLCSA
ncbi:hypothetical protein RB195_004317 [Necator americanus]|uniref:SCP domain-containing protein n=1 Tax=Necator americanus TaxID=51031 RepID=A0ABR1BLW9_NECAM